MSTKFVTPGTNKSREMAEHSQQLPFPKSGVGLPVFLDLVALNSNKSFHCQVDYFDASKGTIYKPFELMTTTEV